MKRFLLISFFTVFSFATKAQTINCNSFCVLGMTLDTISDRLHVTIANNDTNFVNYPTVVVTNTAGDTVGNRENAFYLFGQPANDTTDHNISTTLTSLSSSFTGFVYLTDQVWDITCMFSFPMTCTVGINEYVSEDNFLIYPNPATDKFTVGLNNSKNKSVDVTIIDITGKIVKRYLTNSDNLIIDRDGIQSGLYFISVVSEGQRRTNKVVFK
jgi:hypothetical protein